MAERHFALPGELVSRYEQNLKKWEASGSQGPRPAAPMGPGHAHEPTTLYNGMIAPLLQYTIKGALWYQGETEAGRWQGHVYGDAMMTLVQDWRRAFGQGDFPFYWVQLANYGNAVEEWPLDARAGRAGQGHRAPQHGRRRHHRHRQPHEYSPDQQAGGRPPPGDARPEQGCEPR